MLSALVKSNVDWLQQLQLQQQLQQLQQTTTTYLYTSLPTSLPTYLPTLPYLPTTNIPNISQYFPIVVLDDHSSCLLWI